MTDERIERIAKALANYAHPERSLEEAVSSNRQLWQRFIPEAEVAYAALIPNLAQPSDLTPAQIEGRLAAAKTVPWRYGTIDSIAGGTIYDQTVAIAHVEWDSAGDKIDPRIRRRRTEEQADAVGDLIANAPTDLAYLLAENKRLRAGIARSLSSLNTALGVTNMREWVEGVRLDLTALNGETDD